jgi:transcriptional regulator with XRE-family HTH domain
MGHTIDASGLMRLEKGERRATVDDLVHIAAALNVSPDSLVLPLTDALIDAPGMGPTPAGKVREWFNGDRPLVHDDALTGPAFLHWFAQRPHAAQERIKETWLKLPDAPSEVALRIREMFEIDAGVEPGSIAVERDSEKVED